MNKWVLKDGKNYFKQMTGIGPMETKDIDEAYKFDSRNSALKSPVYRKFLYEPVEVSKRPDLLEPNEDFEIVNETIEGVLKDMGHKIGTALPEGWVFNLVIASVGKKGSTFYISNMERADSMKVLQELIDKNSGAEQ